MKNTDIEKVKVGDLFIHEYHYPLIINTPIKTDVAVVTKVNRTTLDITYPVEIPPPEWRFHTGRKLNNNTIRFKKVAYAEYIEGWDNEYSDYHQYFISGT